MTLNSRLKYHMTLNSRLNLGWRVCACLHSQYASSCLESRPRARVVSEGMQKRKERGVKGPPAEDDEMLSAVNTRTKRDACDGVSHTRSWRSA